MSVIVKIQAREILDSRGFPTVEADVILDSGERGRAAVPSGASTGAEEAIELRDGDKKRYAGRGVTKSIHHTQAIEKMLAGQDVFDQAAIDHQLIALDGSPNKRVLGANTLLAVSVACAKAAALSKKMPLYRYLHQGSSFLMPVPMMNILNGGVHADNTLDIQEFMIVPVGAPSFSEGLRYGAEIFHQLKKVLQKREYNTNVGDEGGFAPDIDSHKIALDLIMEAIVQAGYTPGKDVYLALDIASSEFYEAGCYVLHSENKKLVSEDFTTYLMKLVESYPIISIEDGMAENDWQGWRFLTEALGKKIQLVGDDVFVTNPLLLEKGIKNNIANAILIKPNQIGTLTETLNTIQMAKQANYNTIISHRSGETGDTMIADLSVAVNAAQIKAGSLCRSDRVAKYNQLWRIEEELNNSCIYAGKQVFHRWKESESVA